MSISQVFLKGKDVYHLDDGIVFYFCFPMLGVALPIRPGDYFMFNAVIPHCISSRCKLEDNVICVLFYLKTAIVGMNDNNLSLTPKQSAIIHQLHSSKKKKIFFLRLLFVLKSKSSYLSFSSFDFATKITTPVLLR
jgi:hypothetical protein